MSETLINTVEHTVDLELPENQDQELLYGQFADQKNLYPDFAHQLLKDAFLPQAGQTAEKVAEKQTERRAYWQNYQDLQSYVIDLKDEGYITTFQELLNATKNIQSYFRDQEFPAGLENHIEEVAADARKVFLDSDGNSRLPHLISTNEAKLLAVAVAPLHDILKHLGGFQAQIAIDHQVVTKQFLLQVLPGLKITIDGQERVLTPEEVTFIAEVVGDHENLYQERHRYLLLQSDKSSDRAKLLFFIPDTLTGLIDEQALNQGEVRLRTDQVRLKDLSFRHSANQEKVFRPEWVTHSVHDQLVIMEEYRQAGYRVPLATQLELVDQAVAGVEQAKAAGYDSAEKAATVDHTLAALATLRQELIAHDEAVQRAQ